jgi:Na+/phosphate symporter
MENRIKVDVNEEKVLRLSIPMDEGTIVINNPTDKFKQEVLDEIITFITQNKDFDEKQLMLRLINHCTNVEFVGDIFETPYLSHEARMITNEIMIIFQELVNEAYQVIQLALQQMANEKTQNDLLKEKEQLVKEKKREVKKPKRSKGRIVRR